MTFILILREFMGWPSLGPKWSEMHIFVQDPKQVYEHSAPHPMPKNVLAQEKKVPPARSTVEFQDLAGNLLFSS